MKSFPPIRHEKRTKKQKDFVHKKKRETQNKKLNKTLRWNQHTIKEEILANTCDTRSIDNNNENLPKKQKKRKHKKTKKYYANQKRKLLTKKMEKQKTGAVMAKNRYSTHKSLILGV